MTDEKTRKNLLSSLPKVDQVLAHSEIQAHSGTVAVMIVKAAVRAEIDLARKRVLSGEITQKAELALDQVASRAAARAIDMNRPRLRKVINATGVVLHTNLGRSPLPEEAIRQMALAASGYSNLEYDISSGKRGSRDDLIEETICSLTGAEAATVVNNNAAAVLLALNTMAKGSGVVVSRGELVEIGGAFRIPDVMAASGGRLIEVGTTNRTRISDYEKAIDDDTALLLKVHTSNYRIVGFSEEASIEDLVSLGKKKKLPVLVDLGSGCLMDLTRLGLKEHEPTVAEVVKSGADVVTFSGDKLLGGPQAGIIIGKSKFIESIRKNPMKRALRVGKLTLAALETVLKIYMEPDRAAQNLPALKMISADKRSIAARARRFARTLGELPLEISFVSAISKVGGGALPLEDMPTTLMALEAPGLSAHDLEERLRAQDPPVVGRIVDDRFCLDLRTVSTSELKDLRNSIKGALRK